MGPQRKKALAKRLSSKIGPQAFIVPSDTMLVRAKYDLITIEIELIWQGDRERWEPMVSIEPSLKAPLGAQAALALAAALMEGVKLALVFETEVWLWLAEGL